MELRYRREAAVGVLIVLAAAIFVGILMWLRGQSLSPGEVVQARFADVAGLKEGDPVRTSGVAVGQVTRIRLEQPGQVDVWFAVKNGPDPRADASVMLRAADFFGAMYVDYSPGRSSRPLGRGQMIRGSRAPVLAELANDFTEPARALLGNVTELLSPELTRELRAVLVEARRTLELLGQASATPTRELTGALAELRSVLQRTDQMVAASQQHATRAMRNIESVSSNVDQMTRTLTRTTVALDTILAKINTGRGTVGALVNDTTLLGELRATNVAIRSLIEDFRANPGRYIRFRL